MNGMRILKRKNTKGSTFKATIKGILGKSPSNLSVYELALRHSSISKESNERLEFLGDAILGAIIADYLFRKYPFKDEGFLTEIRSRIVKRDTLNSLAQRIGLDRIVEYNRKQKANKSIYGNALEAFIGATYLDKGYKFTSQFVLHQLVLPHINLSEIIKSNTNYKSTLIEWAQKHQKKVHFVIIDEEGEAHKKHFIAQVVIDGETHETGTAINKKRAEQAAAKKTIEALSINNQ